MMSSTNNKAPSPRALTATQVVAGLAKLEGWQLAGDGASLAIEKAFAFESFHETMAFVNAVAFLAQKHNHHPELIVQFKRCTVRFHTHDVSGLSASDFESAASIDALMV